MQTFAMYTTDAALAVLGLGMLALAVRARSPWGPVGVLLAYLLSELLKVLVQEDRPCRGLAGCPPLGDWSFPSNHATIAGAAAIAIFWSDRRWGLVAGMLALLVATTRVTLGVHHVHDVIIGLLLGAVVGGVVQVLTRRRAPAPDPLDPPTVRLPRIRR